MSNNERTYEGMFILDSGKADFKAASEPIHTILGRTDAEILSIKPWDDRRLAYEISGRRRGLYILTYFKVDPQRISEIEHECELDERVLRAMMLRRDHVTDEEMNADGPGTKTLISVKVEAKQAPKDQPDTAESPASNEPKATANDSKSASSDDPADQPDQPSTDEQAGEEPKATADDSKSTSSDDPADQPDQPSTDEQAGEEPKATADDSKSASSDDPADQPDQPSTDEQAEGEPEKT